MNEIEVSEIKSTFTVYNITLIDPEETFRNYSPFQVTRFLNTISNEWNFISYSNNGKVFTFKDYNESNALKYEKINTMIINNKSISIAIHINKMFNQVKGVIYSKILISMTDEEILESLKPLEVKDVYRFTRDEKPTGSFALTFNNMKLPDYVKIAFLNLNVYPYIEKPMQCLHCMFLGHTAKRCLALKDIFCKECCHKKSEKAEGHICVEVCKNCRGNHFTNSKSCPAYTKEKFIIQLKSTEGISYNEAKRRFNLSSLIQTSDLSRNELDNVKAQKTLLKNANFELLEVNKAQTNSNERLTTQNEILSQQNIGEACGNGKEKHQSNIMDQKLKETIELQQKQIENLLSTITKLKEDNHNSVKNLITKHVKNIKQSMSEKENCLSMLEAVQERNKHLNTETEYYEAFTNSTKVIQIEYEKFKRKIKFEI